MGLKKIKLSRDRCVLVLVDVQERLASAMPAEAMQAVERACCALVSGAKHLGVPVLWTEQYPKGLGPTVSSIKATLADDVSPIEKISFSCAQAPAFRKQLDELHRKQIIVCGMETHVCVYQTVRDLLGDGYRVFVASDAVVSRTEQNRQIGLSLMERAGAVLTSTEAVLFDLLGVAGTPEFRYISALVK